MNNEFSVGCRCSFKQYCVYRFFMTWRWQPAIPVQRQ